MTRPSATIIQSLAVESPSADARARLSELGATKNLDRKIEEARAEMRHERPMPLNHSDQGNADFFLLVAPGKVEQVKFIRGSDALKALFAVLQNTDVGMKFPDKSQVHVPRRASVTCGSGTDTAKKATAEQPTPKEGAPVAAPQKTEGAPGPCMLELIPADSVRGLD